MLLALLLAASPQAPLPLFADPRLGEALGAFEPRAGAWAEYAIFPKRGAQVRLRVSLPGPARADGKYWLEAATQQEGTPPVAFRMLLHGAPGRVENLERLYAYVGGQAPMEMPVDADARKAVAAPRGAVATVQRKGVERVEVAAGRFEAERLEVHGATVWRSARVPLWGLVRARDGGRRVELVGYGSSGAESVFPREFDQGNGSESRK